MLGNKSDYSDVLDLDSCRHREKNNLSISRRIDTVPGFSAGALINPRSSCFHSFIHNFKPHRTVHTPKKRRENN